MKYKSLLIIFLTALSILTIISYWAAPLQAQTPTPTPTPTITPTPVPGVQLSISKSASPPTGSTVAPGDLITYTLSVINSGAQPATNVSVSDSIPANTTFVSSNIGSVAGNTLTWNIGTLPALSGAAGELTVQVSITATSGTIANTAQVSYDNPPIVASSNTVTHTIKSPAGTTIVVNSLDDIVTNTDNRCTLREAITAANNDTASGPTRGECAAGNGDDTIDLTGLNGTITLSSQLPILDSNIIIDGPGIANLTIWNGRGFGRHFFIHPGHEVTISKVTLANGGHSSDAFGGSIHNEGLLILDNTVILSSTARLGGAISNVGDLRLINDTVIQQSMATEGGGIYNFSGTVSLVTSKIISNSATIGKGGGIYNQSASPVVVSNSIIGENSAITVGGGIFNGNGNGTNLKIENSTIIANETKLEGGGIHNGSSSTLVITNSLVMSNTSTTGGGIFNTGFATLTDVEIRTNIADSEGGGIYNNLSSLLEITNNSNISGNTAINGGGIFNNGSGQVTLSGNSSVSDNTISGSGGGIYNFGSLTIDTSAVERNSAGVHGGGIANNPGASATINQGEINDNIAVTGGGGGIANFDGSQLTIEGNSLISGNRVATRGGGIYSIISGNGDVQLTNSSVISNVADDGGGIFNDTNTPLTVDNSLISSNRG